MDIILVTGGNRGIGYAVVKSVFAQHPDATILLGCRNIASGNVAIQQLEADGVTGKVEIIQIDIDSDSSIKAAANTIMQHYGKLDVLVNNAIKLETPSSPDLTSARNASNACYNNAITSNAIVTKAMEPLLRRGTNPRVIMVSSTRGSLGRTANKELPPVSLVDYCIAKAGLNMLVLHLQAREDASPARDGKITFWAVSPGHCKTGFNGFRGTKDPLDGAEVIVRLLNSGPGEIEGGTFWEYESGNFQMLPW